ncbi:MAG: TonB-dependent receptor [Vitreimonas sp.]
MSKKQSGQRKSLLTGASVLAAAAAAMAASPAMAQNNTNTTAPAATSSDDEAIVVTGTRLVRQDFEAISPVTTVGAEQIALTATLTTETLLNDLPQVVPGNTRTSNNSGGEDFSTVDLRGLGPGRTLVLINGERVPASSTTGVVDINTIPASLISRVEVVTGGASAVYGSDAMSGVINFVLKDDYEGAELSATYGSELATGNASEFEGNFLFGGNFANGRGNLTAYGSYYNRNSVLQSEYDWSRTSAALFYNPATSRVQVVDSFAEANALIGAGGFLLQSGGSGTPAWGWITNNGANPFSGLGANPKTPRFAAGQTDTNCDGIAGGAVNTGNLSFNNAGQLTPRNTAAACGVPERNNTAFGGSSRYNFAPDNFIVIPAERGVLTASGHYDINDNVRLNVLMNFVNSRSGVQLAPTPATGLVVTLTPAMRNYISTNHADLWAALQSRPQKYAPFIEDRRTNELGTRNSYNENNEFYAIASLDGQLGDNWDWNLTASYGQSTFISRLTHSANATAFRQGLAGCMTTLPGPDGVLNTVDDTQTPINGALPNCALIDIFGANTMSPAAVAFLDTQTFSQTIIEENRVAGYVRGNLFTLPAGPVSTVFGFEYRDTAAQFHVDNEQHSGNIFGFNALQDQNGQIDVYELYTEFAIPLISEQPFAYYLGLEGGYRISNYSAAGNVETWKAGGEWAPVQWLRFRGIYNVATRAPNVFELFQAGDQGFPAFTEPCRDANTNGVPDQNADTNPNNNVNTAACTNTGGINPVNNFAPGFIANNTQVQALAFGNTALQPETADTYTAGVVFQPDWFPLGDLRATADYYHIQIDNVIAAFGAQTFINQCYATTQNAAACARITRDATTGQITNVNTSRGNQGTLETAGWDFQVEWSLPLGPGQLTLNELYSLVDTFSVNGTEYVGKTSGGIGGATYDWKSTFSATYTLGDWTFLGRWSYVPALEDEFAGIFGVVQDVPAASYIDLSARWNVTDNFSITGVVNNVLDDAPPQTVAGTLGGQGNTDPAEYRVLGRSFAVSGRLRF